MSNLRAELKHNFIKQMIFRLDFDGIMEADIEQAVLELRQKIFTAGYSNMEKRYENPIDFQVKIDLNIPSENKLLIGNSNENLIYRFSSEEQEVLELSKSFFTLTVDIDKKYETFDKYISLLAEIVESIRGKSPFFKALRMGLRKTNICFLNNLKLLSCFFTKATFNIGDIMKQFNDCQCTAANMIAVLEKDSYKINYIRNIQEGLMQEDNGEARTVYQIVLDIDVFRENNKDILAVLSNRESVEVALKKQNTIEFEIFIQSLDSHFIEELKENFFDNAEILGVN